MWHRRSSDSGRGGEINYPYLYARGKEGQDYDCKKHCSFCCSLLTPALLKACDFDRLDDSKNWFDVTISHDSLAAGLHNYLFCSLPSCIDRTAAARGNN